MSERDFWLLIRRALLMVCKAIEQRYCGVPEKVCVIGVDN